MTPKYKVKLSPRLKLGVGRSTATRANLLPYATMIILVISAVLTIRVINLVVTKGGNAEAGQVLGASDTPANTPTQPFKDYVVQKGDTVFSIGQSHNIDWTTLATLNDLKAPFALKPGQTLKVPQQ